MSPSLLPTHESYLVIGGGTFLGELIVEQLLRRGETRVNIFDSQPLIAEQTARFGNGVRVYVGDILVPESIADTVNHLIIHTGMVSTAIETEARYFSSYSPSQTPADHKKKLDELMSIHKKVNTEGTRHVLAAALEHGAPRKLVYIGNANVVFDGEDRPMLRKADAQQPAKCWDKGYEPQAHGERMVLSFNGLNELRTAVIRPATVFGPGFVLGLHLLRIRTVPGIVGIQIGENTNFADRTFVANAAHAAILTADRLSPTHPQHSATAGKAFFITDGAPRPFWDFSRSLWAATGGPGAAPTIIGKGTMLFVAAAKDMVGNLRGEKADFWKKARVMCATRTYDISLAREVLGYAPIVSHDEGIRRTAEWWLEQQLRACKEKRAITDTSADEELPAYKREEVSWLAEKSPFF
ncbi:3-beta hydroxysteroid dehydrogenase/isomerase family-domain-containing protein [Mycena metata]|uniref:3-beta hydroxysteroid dehydrogenase/isomerase family-domain-containing protein n=1 Tax=Mycena metata TaxID=1033252 RepID=A0AAD7J8T5_9AGAR|nr:3-beta hydroxysteroid dehydrogenase/isomerase family-domain-containing protein [Mycena metata]